MIQGESIERDKEKNAQREWTLISISSEPTLYLNVQMDGIWQHQVMLPGKGAALRIGGMLRNLPRTLGAKHESFFQQERDVWDGRMLISKDRDLWRVQMPTQQAATVLEQVNTLLPAGDRFEIYRGVGLVRGDYRGRMQMKYGNKGELVFDAGHGRYAVIGLATTLTLYELHRKVQEVQVDGDKLELVYRALDWVSYA